MLIAEATAQRLGIPRAPTPSPCASSRMQILTRLLRSGYAEKNYGYTPST